MGKSTKQFQILNINRLLEFTRRINPEISLIETIK
jgi:hypothetical protein